MRPMSNKIERRKDRTGRIAFQVGYALVYDEQEAIDLTQTGVFKVRCPLTRQAMEHTPTLPARSASNNPPGCVGHLDRFPWDK